MAERRGPPAPGVRFLLAELTALLAGLSSGDGQREQPTLPPRLIHEQLPWRLVDEVAGLALELHPNAEPFRLGVRTLQARASAQVELSLDDSLEDPTTRASALDFVCAWLEGALYLEREMLGDTCVGLRLCFGPKGAAARTVASWEAKAELGWRARMSSRTKSQLACRFRVGLARPTPLQERPPWAPWIGWGGHMQMLASDSTPAQALQIDGELDLHNFSPKEVGRLVREYIVQARSDGVLQLRIVHGKGKGVLRRTVHAELERNEAVKRFTLGGAGAGSGSWGATLVNLHPLE